MSSVPLLLFQQVAARLRARLSDPSLFDDLYPVLERAIEVMMPLTNEIDALVELPETLYLVLLALPSCRVGEVRRHEVLYDLAPLELAVARVKSQSELRAQFLPRRLPELTCWLLSERQGARMPYGVPGTLYKVRLKERSSASARRTCASLGMLKAPTDLTRTFIGRIGMAEAWMCLEQEDEGLVLAAQIYDPESAGAAGPATFSQVCVANRVLVRHALGHFPAYLGPSEVNHVQKNAHSL